DLEPGECLDPARAVLGEHQLAAQRLPEHGAVELRQLESHEVGQMTSPGELPLLQAALAQRELAEALPAGHLAGLHTDPALGRREQLPAGLWAVADQVRGPRDGALVHEVSTLCA